MRAAARIGALAVAALAAGPLLASGWEGLYKHTEKPRVTLSQPEEGVCVREILDAQIRYNIPNNILLGIGLQEAGLRLGDLYTVWPWAVNAAGEGRVFDSGEEALAWVHERQAMGVRSIDIGCMQVNLQWHPNAFTSPEAGFDPARNVDYAASFLRDLYYKTGDWELAAGSYHSFTPELRAIYLDSLRRNVAAANGRIDEFRDIAGVVGATVSEAAVVAAPGGILWSSGISQIKQGEDGARTLYSRDALQPLLPQFGRGE
ncbi:transglycosylase SLT domain-containing protein [Seohaeicola zhoushanensis]|uniref:Transglycosylase SLT domain-containing protein n=1 Tax=Seohaeicola zhoushanensis TaxID=1569283 RepID=A0A8J3GTW6_9RHOB|nr:transglycosylase SLT domain-containing protein [Seohaeicola zhoushanensis]GHF36031.1 hypothetical protein GCM10017056_04740 [Seohaeicola zhoushanensis]